MSAEPHTVQRRAIDSADLAYMLKASKRTVKRLVADEAVPGMFRLGKLVRFELASVERWIADGCPRPRRK